AQTSAWRHRLALMMLGVALAVFAVYAGCYANAFLYDDNYLIVGNQFLRHWRDWPLFFMEMLGAGANINYGYYRPLQQLLYMAVYHIEGLSTEAFHFLNIALHAANACLMLALGRKLDFRPIAVFAAALLWAVHPVQTEAVVYMSATADPLYVFFCLSGLLVLLPDFSPRRIGAACLFFVCALLGKESALSFPLLAASLLYYISKDRLKFHTYLRLWPLAAIGGLYILLHGMIGPHEHIRAAIHAPHQLPSFLSGIAPFAVLPFYARFMLWPFHFYMRHEIDQATWAWGVCLLAGVVMAIGAGLQIARKQTPGALPLSWGLAWFFAAYLPVCGIGDIAYEHWMYLPSLGLFLGAAQSMALFLDHRGQRLSRVRARAGIAGILMLAGLLGFVTWQQNKIWRSPESFYGNIIVAGAPAPHAHTDIGLYYASEGKYREALREYDIAAREYAVSSDLTTTPENRAILQTAIAASMLGLPDGKTQKKRQEALRHLRQAEAINPDGYAALDMMAKLYTEMGDKRQAALYRRKVERARMRFGTAAQGN
ncbi:MAG: hypothetical protein KGI97_04905, partial [Alphaproteobacteria bacterium]|nr:hypothetical protein [Alphaproteobacteria bacterium]